MKKCAKMKKPPWAKGGQRAEKPPSARQTPPIRGRWRLRQKGSGGPAGPEGENFAIARNISDCRKVLSPTRCGGSPLAEGAKESTIYQTRRLALSGSLLPSSNS